MGDREHEHTHLRACLSAGQQYRDSQVGRKLCATRPSTDPLYQVGHDHIAYNVRPSDRRKGYGRFMIEQVVAKARSLGLPGVSLTLEGENTASVQLIEHQGGNLEREDIDPQTRGRTALYWIPLD